MHKLVVLYSMPADPDHFRDYYVTNHIPLVTLMPGLLACRYSFDVAATQGDAPYFAIFEADFADADGHGRGEGVAAGPAGGRRCCQLRHRRRGGHPLSGAGRHRTLGVTGVLLASLGPPRSGGFDVCEFRACLAWWEHRLVWTGARRCRRCRRSTCPRRSDGTPAQACPCGRWPASIRSAAARSVRR